MHVESWDRRRYFRVKLSCQALILRRGSFYSGDVEDLSLGGALINSETQPSPIGNIHVILIFCHADPIVIPARTVNSREASNGNQLVAFEFSGLNGTSKTAIEKALLEDLKHTLLGNGTTALVVDQSPMIRRSLCDSLSMVGVNASSVATNLDTLEQLHRPDVAISTVFVGLPFGSVTGADLVLFLTDEYPDLRVVALLKDSMVDDSYERTKSPLPDYVLLRTPWSPLRLGGTMIPNTRHVYRAQRRA